MNDVKKFETMKVWNTSRGRVEFQRETNDDGPRFYVVEFGGNGRYFSCMADAVEYLRSRFGVAVETAN